MPETETRPVRPCDSCAGVDDHPRHVVAYGAGEGPTDPDTARRALANAGDDEAAWNAVYAHISNDNVVMKHMDCCRDDGCPDGTCDTVTDGAEDLRGDELVKHLTKEN